jgi:hypothetical protein
MPLQMRQLRCHPDDAPQSVAENTIKFRSGMRILPAKQKGISLICRYRRRSGASQSNAVKHDNLPILFDGREGGSGR